jgi:hypothetical protein
VPVRELHNGWTREVRPISSAGSPNRLGREACRACRQEPRGAYKLRRRADAESFAAAWDAALAQPFESWRKTT